MGLLRRARKSNPSGTEGKSAPQSSRIEERLRTARILAEEEEDDDELHGRSKRTKAQIERDLSDPRVHKRIVENLYGAYKSRVRSRFKERRIFFFFLITSFDLSFRPRFVLNQNSFCVFSAFYYARLKTKKNAITDSLSSSRHQLSPSSL